MNGTLWRSNSTSRSSYVCAKRIMECKCIKPLACKLRVVYRAMLPESSSASARPRPPFAKAPSAFAVTLQQVGASPQWSHKLTLFRKDALLECSLHTLIQFRFLHIHTIYSDLFRKQFLTNFAIQGTSPGSLSLSGHRSCNCLDLEADLADWLL